jgi:hypothetical protein
VRNTVRIASLSLLALRNPRRFWRGLQPNPTRPRGSSLSKLDSTAFPPSTVFIFTANGLDGLESRFLSRTRQVEFSSYGMASAIAGLLRQIWQSEGGKAEETPDVERISKNSRNNVRDALMTLETELLAA